MNNDFFHFEQTEILEKYNIVNHLKNQPIWNRILPSRRKGDTGIGFTLEQLLGIKENNNKKADIPGYEVKSSASESSDITLFSQNPTFPKKATHLLVGIYAKQNGNFNTNLKVGRKTKFDNDYLTICVNDKECQIEVKSENRGVIAVWTFNHLRKICSNKLMGLIFVSGKNINGSYLYTGCKIYTGFNFSSFINCIKSGMISIHFRSKKTIKGIRNRGTAFRIDKRNIHIIYEILETLTDSLPPDYYVETESDPIFIFTE